MDYVGSRYVPKVYENSLDPSSPEWEGGRSWEPFILVTYNLDAYISRKIIPSNIGDPASNPDYWTRFGFYNGQITIINTQLQQIEGLTDGFITPQMYGAVADGVNDDTAAIQSAVTECDATGKTLIFPDGEYLTSQTIAFNDPSYDVVMLGVIKYTGTTSAMSFEHVRRRTLKLRVTRDLPLNSAVGISINGMYNCNLYIERVHGFLVGLDLVADASNRWIAYNNIFLNLIVNCQTGIRLYADEPDGWVNENVFYGGRIYVDSDSGITATAVLIDSAAGRAYYNNNNVFVKPSVEESDIGFHIAYGSYNRVISGRFEGSTTSVLLENSSSNNIIEGHDITVVSDNSISGYNSVNNNNELYQHKFRCVFKSAPVDLYAFENGSGVSLPPLIINQADNTYRSYLSAGHKGDGCISMGTTGAFVVKINTTEIVGKKIGIKGYSKNSQHRYVVRFFDSNDAEILGDFQANMSLSRYNSVDGSPCYMSGADRTNLTPVQQIVIPNNAAYMYIGVASQTFIGFELFAIDFTTPVIIERVFNQGLASTPTVTTYCKAGDICYNTGTGSDVGWRFDGTSWNAFS